MLIDCASKIVECFLSIWKYKKQEVSQFFTFKLTLKYLVTFTRDYYKKVLCLKEGIPFITVSHDGWYSKDNGILGVSIHFVVVNIMHSITAFVLVPITIKTDFPLAICVLYAVR